MRARVQAMHMAFFTVISNDAVVSGTHVETKDEFGTATLRQAADVALGYRSGSIVEDLWPWILLHGARCSPRPPRGPPLG